MTSFLRRRRSFSFWDIATFVTHFVVTYGLMWLTLYVSLIITNPGRTPLTRYQWWAISVGSLGVVVVTYFRELFVVRRKARTIKDNKVIYDCIGGAIEQLIEIKEEANHDTRYYINELLKYIEKIVEIVLKQNGIEVGELCANLMIKRTAPDRLALVYFGTFLHGRSRVNLSLGGEMLNPGAPEAYALGKVMYIDNTMSEKYRQHFDENKPYRSIISIPVGADRREPFAILNIDSDIADQFSSVDFINKKVLPTVSPMIQLIRLERRIILEGALEEANDVSNNN